MPVTSVARIDKADLKRYTGFINDVVIDPKVKNPRGEEWKRCIRMFHELLSPLSLLRIRT